jgi:three-Cys-motif partner protein
LIVFDGFCGPGEYRQGDGTRFDGSPAVALKSLLQHSALSRMPDVQVVFVFSDTHKPSIKHLREKVLPGITRPQNVQVHTDDREFHEVANSVLDLAQGQTSGATFAFVDPFGWKGVHMDVLARVLARPRSEVLVNLALNRTNQFFKAPQDLIQSQFDALFGTTRRPDLEAGPDRVDIISDFYIQQLGAHARYVWPFRMHDGRNRPVYDLVFATNNLTGLEKMKDAMWKIDPVTGATFSDRSEQATRLFEPEPDFTPLRRVIADEFANRAPSVEELEYYVLTETPYKKTHLRRPVLIPLEKSGKIRFVGNVSRPNPKVLSYPAKARLRFAPQD